MTRVRKLTLTLFAVAFGAMLYSQGCGGGNDPVPVTYRGNVTSVELPASASRPANRENRLASLPSSLGFDLVSRAVAQSGECSTTTQQNLHDVFLCVATSHGSETGAGTPTPTPRVNSHCVRVDAGTCEFNVELRLEADHDFALLAFTNSPDGTGEGDAAFLTGYEPQEFCNGDVIHIPDVDIDFPRGQANPGSPITKEIDACGAAPTPTRTPTHSGGSATHTPTPTGPTPTATDTPEEGAGTPTPTPTGPTPTPEGTATVTPTPGPVVCSGFGQSCAVSLCCTNGNVCVPGAMICL